MKKLEHEKTHMNKQNHILDNNEALMEDIKNELLPMTAKEIETQAVDEGDKAVLEEIMEQNIILKVLEQELKQQEDIS